MRHDRHPPFAVPPLRRPDRSTIVELLGDGVLLLAVVWTLPLAILALGATVALLVRLLIEIAAWM